MTDLIGELLALCDGSHTGIATIDALTRKGKYPDEDVRMTLAQLASFKLITPIQ
jgi:hypothetical protein